MRHFTASSIVQSAHVICALARVVQRLAVRYAVVLPGRLFVEWVLLVSFHGASISFGAFM